MVQNLVRSTLSLTFVIAAARVVFNVKARMTREATWQLELKGDLTKQRRVEAVDKLLSVLTLLVASVFGLQAIGLDGEYLLIGTQLDYDRSPHQPCLQFAMQRARDNQGMLFCAVNSVLAIGGVGGLAVGLAGREILENLFTGLIILSSSPFEVGDEVLFSPPSGQVRLGADLGLFFRILSSSVGSLIKCVTCLANYADCGGHCGGCRLVPHHDPKF